MQKITDEELKAVRAKSGRGVVVLGVKNEDGVTVGDFAFKKIDRAAYAQYRASVRLAANTGGGTGEEEQQLARSLMVWPEDKSVFDALREDAPAVATSLGAELLADADSGFSVSRDPR